MAEEVIARRNELHAIATFVADIPAGGHAMLISGDAGIGKTTLWRAGLQQAEGNGLRILVSRTSPSETQTAFACIGDLFARVVDETSPALPPVQRHALEGALLMREPDGAPPDARLLGIALASVVQTVSRDSPVLFAIDDAQWVDASSAEILRFVMHRLASLPVGVLATVRGRRVDAPFELDRSFARFRRLTVAPLSAGAVHSLLWDRLELALPRPALLRVHAVSGGNAFFALELGRGIVDGTIRIDADEVPLPDSLMAVVEQRLQALPARITETLVAVAALSAASVTVLKPLGGTTVRDLEIAASRDVIVFDGDRIRFTHPLLSPACYALLPLHRRREVHRRLADLDLDSEERARHLALATVGVDESVAATLDAAAASARSRGAAQAAAELAERAVVLTPRDAAQDILRRLLAVARLSIDAGDMHKARSTLEVVIGSAPPGPIRAEALTKLAEVRGLIEGNPVTSSLLLRALDEPDLDDRQRARIYGALVNSPLDYGTERMAYAETGLALAEEAGDPEVLVTCLAAVADLTFGLVGQLRRDLLDRAIEIHRATRVAPSLDPRSILAYNLGRMGRFEESRAVWAGLISDCAARDDPDTAIHVYRLARMEVGSGRWDLVEQRCAEAIEHSRQTGREITEALCRMVLAELDAYRGDADPVALADQVSSTQPESAWGGASYRLSRALASLQLSLGDPAGAWTQLGPRLDGLEQLDEGHAQLAGSAGIEALIGIGDLDAAHRLLLLVEERAATAETDLGSMAHRGRGLLLEAHGNLGAAINELEAAAVLPDPPAGRNPVEQARTLLSLGRVHREASHKKAARQTLEQAVEIFEGLGAKTWAERTGGELRRIGGRIPSTGQLTETERRIVELVVAGRRNREVADELFLSPDTVAWNLSRVYRKLGVTSRTQLALRVAEGSDPLGAG